MPPSTDDRCRARIGDGQRCSRPAQEDGFCYQHDESDPTVVKGDLGTDGGSDVAETEETDEADDAEETDEADDAEETDEADDAEETDEADDADGEATVTEGTDEAGDADTEDGDERPSIGQSDVVDVRETVRTVGSDLIGRELDTVSSVESDGDGWRVTLEVVERRAVPDTQDILGRYEVDLDADRSVTGYRRIDRYRRADTDREGPSG